MIQKLHIQNFQSHEKSTLEFSPGVNIIVGNSDSGKTAIIRALRWLIWNRPSGNAIVSNWGGPTSVQLDMEEGNILRSKDKQDSYILTITGKKNIEFKAFGTSVPEEINRFLNINEVNFQYQLDQPFLLSKSPGETATYFNKIAKLDEIDLSISNIKKWITSLTQDLKYKRLERKGFMEQLDSFSYLDEFEIEVEVLEEMEKRLSQEKASERGLQNLHTTYLINEVKIEELQPNLEIEELLDETLNWIQDKEDLEFKRSKFANLIKQICETEEDMQEQEVLIQMEKPLLVILKQYNEKEDLESQQKNLHDIIMDAFNIEHCIKTTETIHKALVIKFNKVFPDKCPLCGLSVPHDH